MNSLKELSANIGAVDTIQSITSVYEGIASLRMNQVKDTVEKTKIFIEGVAALYQHAKSAYLTKLEQTSKKADKNKLLRLSKIKRNGKTVYVYLSANEHLYGSLIMDVYQDFIKDISQDPKADVVVIGDFGKALIQAAALPNKISYFKINDDKPTPAEITKVFEVLIQYQKVILHYGKMRTLLTQVPERLEITGGVDTTNETQVVKDYIFEPSPEAVMDFFEGEIIGALFNQKVFEHQLSRFASRMVAMDQASQNALVLIEGLRKDLSRAKKRVQNTKQLDVFAGISLWKDK